MDSRFAIDTCTGWNRLRKPNHDGQLAREGKPGNAISRRPKIHCGRCGRKDQDLWCKTLDHGKEVLQPRDILPPTELAQRFALFLRIAETILSIRKILHNKSGLHPIVRARFSKYRLQ